jgi:hypothetical protein
MKSTVKRGSLHNISASQSINVNEDAIIIVNKLGTDDISMSPYMKSDSKTARLIAEGISSIGGDDDDKISKREYAWVRKNNNFFISAKPNIENIPAGLYDIRSSMEQGLYLEKRTVILDELFQIPDINVGDIISDMEKFWSRKEKYQEYGITYKRGILMYGPPGTGKTSLINLIVAQIITDHDGIVINMEDINSFIPMVNNIRALEPDKPILALIEDLDSFMSYNSTKMFLNLLDGNLQIDNIMYLATTNYLDRLEDRIKNRPSRFDKRYEIGYPSPDARKFYIENKLKESDLANIDLGKWVQDTNGFTFSHIKELIVSVIVMENDYQKTISQLRNMYAVAD